MQHFRYRAYNQDIDAYEGVIEASNWKEAALKIIAKGYTPSAIEPIDYSTYKTHRSLENKMNNLKKIQAKYNKPTAQPIEPEFKSNKLFYIVLGLITLSIACSIAFLIYVVSR